MGESNFGWWFPPNLGAENAHSIDNLIDYVHLLMYALFVGWGIFFLIAIFRFRQRAGHRATYEPAKAKASKGIEIAIVAAELVLLFGFSMPVWAKVKNEVPSEKDAMVVRCVAEQFNWNFHYPGKDGKFGRSDPAKMTTDNPLGLDREHDPDAKDDIVTLNELHIPVDKPVVVRGTSKDVIHSFSIPVLRAKQDLIPGMSVPIWFRATHTTDDFRNSLIRSYTLDGDASDLARRMVLYVPMFDCKDNAGNIVLAARKPFTEESITALQKAGITTVKAAPVNPVEIACAQLCGNTHYRMRGFVSIDTQQDFEKWLVAQAAASAEEEE